MKKIYLFLLTFLCMLNTQAVVAGNLCDADCNLTISFPDGGSIEAVEPLTITFGEGGYINDGAVITGYAAGETLSLAADESLVFTDGGALDIGVDGNIDYTNMSITTNGVIEVTASGGNELVSIFDMTISGTLEVVFNSDVIIVESGALTTIGGDISLTGADGVSFTVYGGLSMQSGNLLLDVANVVLYPSGGEPVNNCSESGSGVTITSGSSPGIISTLCNSGLTVTGGGIMTIDPSLTATITPVYGGSQITEIGSIEPLTAETLAIFTGLEWITSDGKSCTVTSEGDCITSEGAKYVVVDGELVPAADGSGQLDMYLLLLLCVLLPVLHNQSIFIIRKC